MSEVRTNRLKSASGGVPAIEYDSSKDLVAEYRMRESLLASFALGGLTWREDWVTATVYAEDDVVISNSLAYVCIVPHTSGTFATDLAANKWEELTSKENRVFIPAQLFTLASGTPVLSTVVSNRYPTWLLDAASTEVLQATLQVPAVWGAYNAYVHWTNVGAGSGNVRWQVSTDAIADNESLNVAPDDDPFTGAALSQYFLSIDAAPTKIVDLVPRDLILVQVARVGGDGADTLANDAGFLGLELVKATA